MASIDVYGEPNADGLVRGDDGAKDELPSQAGLQNRVKAIARHAIARLADANVLDMSARYDLARALHEFRCGKGRLSVAQTMATVSSELGVHTSALRRWMRVAGTIPPREFGDYISYRTRSGTPLTWSHVELIAEVTPARARRAVARECVECDLSVRSLAARVRTGRGRNERRSINRGVGRQ